jgi:uncharacterized protein (DUF1697 family)
MPATTYVALLQGVNVGASRRLAMPELRSSFEAAGAEHVKTYVQSGNVVFSSTAPRARITGAIDAAVAELAGAPVPMVFRTTAELDRVVAGNPFTARESDPTKLHVVFLDRPAKGTVPDDLDVDAFAPEEVALGKQELYLLLPNGIGRAKLPVALTRAHRRFQPPPVATVRNWRTTTTLLDMARTLDGS